MAIDFDFAVIRRIETAEDVKQSAFSRSRGSAQRDGFTGLHAEIDALQDSDATAVEGFPDAARANERVVGPCVHS
jgi:hypothetical protein